MKVVKIGIVEDETALFEIIKMSISMFNFECILLSSKDDIAGAIQEHGLKALILDFMMPYKTGLDIAQELRNIETLKTFPLLMLTSRHLHDEEIILIKKLDVFYMKKPFVPHILTGKLTELLSRHQKSELSTCD